VICSLLFLATTINYVDRQILSLIKPILDEQLHWTNGYAISIAAWSIAAMGHALVGTVGGFFNARIALGLGEGGNFPSAIKAVALWFPKKERALATSIFNAGTNVGAILAPALVPWIASTREDWGWKAFSVQHGWDKSLPWISHTWGWHMAFIVAGIAGFSWLLLWLPFYNIPEKIQHLSATELAHIRSDSDEQSSNNNGRKISWLSLLGYRQTWSFIIAKFMTDPVWWFFLIWLPDYFKKTRGLDIKSSWKHLVTIYVIVTVLSIFGGWITGYLTKTGWTVTRARKTGMFIFALCVLPILVVTQVGDWTAVLLIGLAGAAHQAWSANLYTTVSDMFPKRAVASVIGIGGMAGAIGGMLFPKYSGRLLDVFTAKGNITGGYAVLFGICAFAYVGTWLIHHLLAPRLEQIQLKEESINPV
jgi:ACS family hexuronate transporter-like MFS transporter